MDAVESFQTTAEELIALARGRGVDLASICNAFVFDNGSRFIFLWREDDGRIGYNMQGRIAALPREFQESAGSFSGMWYGAGRLPDLERAFEFVAAWLIDTEEVDRLPVQDRQRHRWGIG